jgi:chemotaxis protein methyltransferase CheR
MSAAPRPEDILRFRALVGARMGLFFDDDKVELLAEVLRERLEARGLEQPDTYLDQLATRGGEEVGALARRLTIGETYFFRYLDHFRAFADVVLPDRARYQGVRRQLRILSAGCASGEEAYTLAILLREHLPDVGSWDIRIRGIDINPAMIAAAGRARYSEWSLRETPAVMRERYFQRHGREFHLDEQVRSSVTFETRNLLDEDPSFWQPGSFDVVFFRNVMMYFAPDVMRAIVTRITASLTPGGFLFLGHAETLRGVSSEHHLRHSHDAFYYQRKDADRCTVVAVAPRSDIGGEVDVPMTPPVGSAPHDVSWIEAIQVASDRIATLSGASPSGGSAAREAVRHGEDWDLRPALELLRRERFEDAMDLLRALPAASQRDTNAQLLRAVLLTNAGNLVEAEAVCREILGRDELHAGAHYLVALCREHAGERRAAVEHDQAATYLDASFAMPHLHLGLLARRAGDDAEARTELERALTLLTCEDASRVLLYGGGFSREGLVELCRAELRMSGGKV